MTSQQLSKRRQQWFTAIAILVPFLILLFSELLLRMFGYGHNTSLFIRYPDNKNYYVLNKYASQRFFSDPANETMGYIEPFKVKKGKNTVRIFVLGESTTAGYPYFHNGSFHRWLEYRLMRCYPDIHFEIVNVSLTAVNSYTVLDFGKQLLAYRPDAVLIYTGHNEYYGALGVGSTSHIANNRFLIEAVLTLRKLRIVQLFENIIRAFMRKSPVDVRENLMQRMVAREEIPYGSAKYQAGIRQFRLNMNKLCKLYNRKDIPVFLSTLVSNQKDQPPFISGNGKNDAGFFFRQADSAYQKGNYTFAKQKFIWAKELDMLRFRAPEAMNRIIVQLAQKYKNVHLVHTRQIFEQNSPHQILGKELILDHVHPNLYGYALMSEAFYKAIRQSGILKSDTIYSMSFGELLKRMPVTKIDSLYGQYTIIMLESRWPFNKPIPANFKVGNTLDERLAGALAVNQITWLEAMNRLFQYSMEKGDKVTACKAAEAAMMEYPLNTTYKIYAGRLNYEIGHYEDAIYDMKAAYEFEPNFENTQNMYLIYLKVDQPINAVKYIQSAIRMRPQNVPLQMLFNTVENIVNLKKELKLTPGGRSIKEKIASDYKSIGDSDIAKKYDVR